MSKMFHFCLGEGDDIYLYFAPSAAMLAALICCYSLTQSLSLSQSGQSLESLARIKTYEQGWEGLEFCLLDRQAAAHLQRGQSVNASLASDATDWGFVGLVLGLSSVHLCWARSGSGSESFLSG